MIKNKILFFHLVVQVLFVGLMLGLYRTALPALSEIEFNVPKDSYILLSIFIFSFGLVKGIANYYAGIFCDSLGRKKVLFWGWVIAIPAPLIVFYSQNWNYIAISTAIIGIQQGLTWSASQIAMVDVTNQEKRGFAVGVNEFAGYFGVTIGGIIISYFTDLYDIRSSILIISIIFLIFTIIQTLNFIEETYPNNLNNDENKLSKKDVFYKVSWGSKPLFAYSQVGHIEKFIDVTVWVFVPIYLFNQGISIIDISILVGIYTITWGILQIFSGYYSDIFGRNKLILIGMFLCAISISILPSINSILIYCINFFILGLGMALLYPSISAAVNDHTEEEWRASALGVYRFWRDTGYASGAILIGIISSLSEITTGFYFVTLSLVISNLILLLVVSKK